jgi:uncharacterized membrane protein
MIFYTLLIVILFFIFILIFVAVSETAFQAIGFTRGGFLLILLATLFGSFVNIPVYRSKKTKRVVEVEEVRAFWVTYRIPHVGLRQVSTIIAVNLGGAVIPTLVSAYLIVSHITLIPEIIVSVILTSLIVHLVARKVEGVGIVTPAFIPPIAAAIFALLLSTSDPAIVAYVSGSMGALIGADLTNLRGMGGMGESVASIGGAGTFDGVFLTGIIAVLIVTFLSMFH